MKLNIPKQEQGEIAQAAKMASANAEGSPFWTEVAKLVDGNVRSPSIEPRQAPVER